MVLRAYLRHLADTRTEVAIFLSALALVLVLAEPLTMMVLEVLAPAWHDSLLTIDRPCRRWLIGIPPSSIVLVVGIFTSWRRASRAQ